MKKPMILLPVVVVIAFVSAYIYFSGNTEIGGTATSNSSANKYEVGPPTHEELLELVNKERAKVGSKPLTMRGELNTSAQRKADDMIKYNYFEHVSPNDKREGYEYVFDSTNDCQFASENITDNTEPKDNTTAQTMYNFMSSAPHKAAILDPDYESIGFGIKKYTVVQHFCDLQPR